MPLYIPWLTETIKKRGVRYLLHHYLGHFFDEKLTLEQLSIDIYEGKGSIKDLTLSVDGLNDELDFLPFKFLDGCSIGHISVEVPWSSLANKACKVELDGAVLVCRLKTSLDENKSCNESTLLTRSLMTSSMQMAEDIVTNDDDFTDFNSSTNAFVTNEKQQQKASHLKQKAANEMFDSLEIFAQLIDSVLRRTKLTARNTLFQIRQNVNYENQQAQQQQQVPATQKPKNPLNDGSNFEEEENDNDDDCDSPPEFDSEQLITSNKTNEDYNSDIDKKQQDDVEQQQQESCASDDLSSEETVEFFIKFFRCEEIIQPTTIATNKNQSKDGTSEHASTSKHQSDKSDSSIKPNIISDNCEQSNHSSNELGNKSNRNGQQQQQQQFAPISTTEQVVKLLTLEDVEMRINGRPFSYLNGKHTILIKICGSRSQISIFSSSPLLAVISHKQLETFFAVFDSTSIDTNTSGDKRNHSKRACDEDITLRTQPMMSAEDYEKIENQLLESAASRVNSFSQRNASNFIKSTSGRSWIEANNSCKSNFRNNVEELCLDESEFSYAQNSKDLSNSSNDYDDDNDDDCICKDENLRYLQDAFNLKSTSLDNIEAFSCELKLPGIWICIIKDGQEFPANLIKSFADLNTTFEMVNKHIDSYISVPHLRFLALKVSLNITSSRTNVFLGELEISEHCNDSSMIKVMNILSNTSIVKSKLRADEARYKFSVINKRDIRIELPSNTTLVLDPTLIDRLFLDYKLIKLNKLLSNNNNKKFSSTLNCDTTTFNFDTNVPLTTTATNYKPININVKLICESLRVELLCPIPDLTPAGMKRKTELRPQSFVFDFDTFDIQWAAGKLVAKIEEVLGFVKSQPHLNGDENLVQFLLATSKDNKQINITFEPSPCDLNEELNFTNINQVLNEASMYDSIYVSHDNEQQKSLANIFQAKRKVVKPSKTTSGSESSSTQNSTSASTSSCESDKITTPADRQHLTDYLKRASISTKYSVKLEVPVCSAEFEDKEQLDLIYNRFCNDFVFWKPKILSLSTSQQTNKTTNLNANIIRTNKNIEVHNGIVYRQTNDFDVSDQNDDNYFNDNDYQNTTITNQNVNYKYNNTLDERKNLIDSQSEEDNEEHNNGEDNEYEDRESESSFHSFSGDEYSVGGNKLYDKTCNSSSTATPNSTYIELESQNSDSSDSLKLDNELTCSIDFQELFIKFNHQNCAASMRQEIASSNVLVAIILELNKKPETILSIVADDLELKTDNEIVLEGNLYGDKNSLFALTAQIVKSQRKSVKHIKLATQLVNGLLNDFKTDTFTRFWQSVNVTDEPILGYKAPRIIIEFYFDILTTAVKLVRQKARPALISIDELYLTSRMLNSNQVLFKLSADELSLYLKRSKQDAEIMKNYICLIDTGLINIDVKFTEDIQRTEFNVINNVITLRVCHDSLKELLKLFAALAENSNEQQQQSNVTTTTTATNSQFNKTSKLIEEQIKSQLKQNLNNTNNYNHQLHEQAVFNRFETQELLNDAMASDLSPEMKQKPSTATTTTTNLKLSSSQFPNAKSINQRNRLAMQTTATTSDDTEHETSDCSNDEDESSSRQNLFDLEFKRLQDNDDINDNDDGEDENKSRLVEDNLNDATCLLDRSMPKLDDLPLPLIPTTRRQTDKLLAAAAAAATQSISSSTSSSFSSSSAACNDNNSTNESVRNLMDESGFFIIGDDDIGVGIMNKQQTEPLVRNLIGDNVNVIENYFKIKPRSLIPDMLKTCVKRYVLEEMSLVVNLFGGHDFEDTMNEKRNDISTNNSEANNDYNNYNNDGDDGDENLDCNITNENDDYYDQLSTCTDQSADQACFSASSSSVPRTDDAAMMMMMNNNEKNAFRSRTCSLTSNESNYNRQQQQQHKVTQIPSSSSSSASMMKKQTTTTRVAPTSRRKNRSESANDYSSSTATFDSKTKSVRFGEGVVSLWESLDLMSANEVLKLRKPMKTVSLASAKATGGTWRQNDACIQLSINKVKLLYERANTNTNITTTTTTNNAKATQSLHAKSSDSVPISFRFMLFVDSFEICDKIRASKINKMLYEYCTESMPRRNNSPMLVIRNIATVNQTDGVEECDLRVSLKPLRINVDQDALSFLVDFFTSLNKSLNETEKMRRRPTTSVPPTPATSTSASRTNRNSKRASGKKQSSNQAQANQFYSNSKNLTNATSSNNSSKSGSKTNIASSLSSTSSFSSSTSLAENNTPSTTSQSGASSPMLQQQQQQQQQRQRLSSTTSNIDVDDEQSIYIKSFTFSPDVHIRLDYNAKHLDFEQGALAGILLGLTHLDHSELVLRSIHAKHGVRGLDRVLLFVLNSWLTDIKRNQLTSILGGVGPMHSVVQLVHGLRDLFWLPIDQYRRDKRLVRGLQRGASSFSSRTAMAAIDLTNRLVSLVHCTAQFAHDIVTPSSNRRNSVIDCASIASMFNTNSGIGHRYSLGVSDSRQLVEFDRLQQPRNFCEGMTQAYSIIREGFNETARNVAVGMQTDDVREAVGELVRQIPSTLLSPIISATEGAQNVLVGLRNQLTPDARRDDQDKWKAHASNSPSVRKSARKLNNHHHHHHHIHHHSASGNM